MTFLIKILLFCSVTAIAGATDQLIVTLNISGHDLLAEVAYTPTSRAQGLMHRDALDENYGMLFVFPKADRYSMWMLNTKIPLSVAFIDHKGVILNIEDMTPYTKTAHSSAGLAKYALEMNQGWFLAKGIRAGERVVGLMRVPAAR